jgi:asparagine synthetase B (glutamine-hydrolysing)
MPTPLANLFAVADPSPANLDAYETDLAASGEFGRVWRPAPGWVAAIAPLPGTTVDELLFDRYPIAFVEGRDVVVESGARDTAARLEQVAATADEWPDSLSRLPGDFGFVGFRPRGEATVVRSCGGLVPFYLSEAGGCRMLATRIGDIVRFGPNEPELDPLVTAIWASSWIMMPDRRTFLTGVSLLPPGHYARIGDTPQVARYWRPRPQAYVEPTPARRREHAERLRGSVLQTLERDLDPGDGNLLTLSGGADSSTLLALATGVLGRRMKTFSVIPGAGPSHERDQSFLKPLLERFPVDRHWLVATSDWRYLLQVWREAPRVVFPIIHPALCSLPGLMREAPVRVLIGGEYADETCGQDGTGPDWARATPPWRMLATALRAADPPRFAYRWGRDRIRGMRGQPAMPFPPDVLGTDILGRPSTMFHEQVRDEYRAWWVRTQRTVAADRGPWRDLALFVDELSGAVPMNWEACSALGVRRTFPFFTREVLDLAFDCHPSELYGPGVKELLKAAVHRDVPARNLNRLKGGHDAASRTAREAVSAPLPEGGVPHELSKTLEARWLTSPPGTLDYAQLRTLTRLTLFVDGLRARRADRGRRRL